MNAPFRYIYLASRSPRRREILTQIGVRFEMLLLRDGAGREIDVDETPRSGEPAQDYVIRLAREKAETGWSRMKQRHLPPAPVLAADTAVARGAEIIGKPADREDAIAILMRLSGTTHEVHTAVAVMLEGRLESVLSSTSVSFGRITEDEARRYVVSGEPMDKAGAYGIQGRAAVFVEGIAGSFTGVMGLPAFETAAVLRKFGFVLP